MTITDAAERLRHDLRGTPGESAKLNLLKQALTAAYQRGQNDERERLAAAVKRLLALDDVWEPYDPKSAWAKAKAEARSALAEGER